MIPGRNSLMLAAGAALVCVAMASCIYVGSLPPYPFPTVSGPMTVDGPLTVNGPLRVSGPLVVHGLVRSRGIRASGGMATTLPHENPGLSGQSAGGPMSISGPLTVHGPLTVVGPLAVSGPVTAEGFDFLN